MSTRSSITPYVNALQNDSLLLTALVDDALVALDVGLAGWPTSTPGASQDPTGVTPPPLIEDEQCIAVQHGRFPCVCHLAARESSTQTEQAALAPDVAERDMREMVKALKAAQVAARKAATIAQRWASPRLNKSTVQQRLATIDAGIWCTNHIAHGMREPRRDGRTLCDLCEGFHAQFNEHAPFEVLDFKARGGRLDEAKARYLLQLSATRKKALKRKRTA